jgi:hypothetical protein
MIILDAEGAAPAVLAAAPPSREVPMVMMAMVPAPAETAAMMPAAAPVAPGPAHVVANHLRDGNRSQSSQNQATDHVRLLIQAWQP